MGGTGSPDTRGTHILRAVRKLAWLLPLFVVATTAARAAPASPVCAGVLLSAATGAPMTGADTIYGSSVVAVANDGQGGWYVGGDFWRVGNQSRTNLAHIDRNGHVYAGWHPGVDGRWSRWRAPGGRYNGRTSLTAT